MIHNIIKKYPPELPTSMAVGRFQPALNGPNIKMEESSTQTQSGTMVKNASTPTKSNGMVVEPPT